MKRSVWRGNGTQRHRVIRDRDAAPPGQVYHDPLAGKQKARLEQGRKPVLTKADIDVLKKRLHALIVRPFEAYHEMTSANRHL